MDIFCIGCRPDSSLPISCYGGSESNLPWMEVLEPLSKIQTTGQLYHRDTESQRKLSFCGFASRRFWSVARCRCGGGSAVAASGVAAACRWRLGRAEYHQAEPEI